MSSIVSIIIGLAIGAIISAGVIFYKIGKQETYHRPCGGGRHNA